MRALIRTVVLMLLAASANGQETYLYVVDIGFNREAPWQVIRYDENGSNPEVFITEELSRPQDIVFLEKQGVALVSNLRSGRITKYDAETGAYIGDFATGIGEPTRMEIGADGLLYVLQWAGNGRVLRYAPDGTFVDEFTDVGVSQSIGIAWDEEGRLYVASFNGAFVRRFDTEGNDLGLFVSSNLQGPTNIWFDDDGDLLVMDWSGLAIRRFNENGFFQQNFVLGLTEPEGVEFLDDGHILVGNGGTSSVREYDADGVFVRDFVPPGSGGLAKPNALRFREVSDLRINAGMSDAWFNPETAGQGLLVAVFPDLGQMFVAMFTYDVERPPDDVTAQLGEPGHRWFTAQGPFSGNRAELAVTLTQGGVFDAPEPQPTNDPDYGTLSLEFTDCSNLLVTYDLPGPGVSGEIPMTRIVEDNVALCEELNALGTP